MTVILRSEHNSVRFHKIKEHLRVRRESHASYPVSNSSATFERIILYEIYFFKYFFLFFSKTSNSEWVPAIDEMKLAIYTITIKMLKVVSF